MNIFKRRKRGITLNLSEKEARHVSYVLAVTRTRGEFDYLSPQQAWELECHVDRHFEGGDEFVQNRINILRQFQPEIAREYGITEVTHA